MNSINNVLYNKIAGYNDQYAMQGAGGGYNNMGSYSGQNGGDYGPQRSNYNQSNRSSGPYGGLYCSHLAVM